MSHLDELRASDKESNRRTIIAIIIVAIILLIIFALMPIIIEMIAGDTRENPSERLHGWSIILPLLSQIL